ncbi:MAG: GNAT family N-acetyltransferase [Chloroflexota bacterium]|nr:GNAT family N-acetyltransferase [Chloroflexota bacterium]
MATRGRLLQVNVSRGGVPKLPVAEAWVGRSGLEGDGHRERTVHGGPHRAVCLFSIEAIERLQAEGHPVEPGSVGENLTTLGVEWSLLPVGTRARIGDQVEVELASPTMPCSTQRPNFRDGRVSRISIDLHPSDSRMYARVLAEGTVRPGDEIEIVPPAPGSRAADELLLARLDRAVGRSSLAGWRIARDLGRDIRIVDDGELLMAAAPAMPGPRWNQALGLARLPELVGDAQRFFDDNATVGWIVTEAAARERGQPGTFVGVFAAAPGEISDAAAPPGVRIRQVTPADLPAINEVRRAGGSADLDAALEAAFDAAVLELPHSFRLIAELDGEPVAVASLHASHGTGWMRGAMVVPAARGRGIQRALIRERARLANEQGCDLVGAWAEVSSVSAANMSAVGLRKVGLRQHQRYAPAGLAQAR